MRSPGKLIGLLGLVAVSRAQPPLPSSEPTVVTVTGQSTPLSAADASVTVLTRKLIEDSHAGNLADLLRQTPFLFLTQSGGKGGLTTVTLRGGKPNFTLVILDGIPVNDITNVLGGSFDFSTMSTDNVEQVEIVRGPLSALYGSDAVAGVINIISRRGEGKSSFQASGALGNFTARELEVGAAGKLRNFDYSFAGSYQDVGVQVENDPFRLGSFSFNSHLALGSHRLLSLFVRYADSQEAGFPSNGGGPEYAIDRQAQSVHSQDVVSGIGWQQQVSARWLYALSLDLFDSTGNSSVPPILDAPKPTFRSVPAESFDTEFRRVRASLTNTVRIAGNWSASFGAGWRGERGNSRGLLGAIPDAFTISRSTASGNAELSYRSDRPAATLGLRADAGQGFHMVYSPRAGISYRLSRRGPRLKSSWGKGFKLPSFYALADPIVGNRQLKPEFSGSYEVGMEQDLFRERVHAGLTVFRNDYRDLVDFSSQLFRLVNRSEAQTKGAEFSLTVPVHSNLEIGGRVWYLDWQLKQSTDPLRDQPHWQAGASASWKPARHWQTRLDTLWVGRRYDFSVPLPNQPAVGGYSTTSAATHYELSHGVTAFVRADNLFNARYHEFIGFPNPGITVRAGLAWRAR
jgi:outer membrane cobalamin receptor